MLRDAVRLISSSGQKGRQSTWWMYTQRFDEPKGCCAVISLLWYA
jgi:hypothetical protein